MECKDIIYIYAREEIGSRVRGTFRDRGRDADMEI